MTYIFDSAVPLYTNPFYYFYFCYNHHVPVNYFLFFCCMGNSNMGNSKVVLLFLFDGPKIQDLIKYKRLNYLFIVESALSLSS